MSEVIAETLQRVSAVATLPSIAVRIMRIAEDPASTTDEMHDVLASDPALAARVLKVVNSAFYGRPRQVSSTYAAVQLLGASAIRNIALAASLTRMFRGGRTAAGFDASSLWVHSVGVGAVARRLAETSRKVAPDEAMLAGLLHDIGVLVSMQAWLPEFTAVIAATRDDASLDFRAVEQAVIGADHEQIGQALCVQWHFPASLGRACGHHHEPLQLPAEEQLLPALVHIADILTARADIGFTRTVRDREIAPEVLAVVGLSASDLPAIEQNVVAELTQAMLLFAG